MALYTRQESRKWAKENLHGLANVVIPSFTQDLEGLNETGIRHDVRRSIDLGFTQTSTLGAETATKPLMSTSNLQKSL